MLNHLKTQKRFDMIFTGIKSTCDQCVFATTRLSDPKRQQLDNHEGRTDNNAVDPVFMEALDMNVADTGIKKEEIS